MKRHLFFYPAILLGLLVIGQAHGLSLHEKAAVFQYDMETRFLLNGQALCKLRHPEKEGDPITYNMPDNCYMTGIYLGTLSMKYAVTGKEQDRAAALQSLEALHLLSSVSGVPGLWARAALPAEQPVGDDGIWRPSADGLYQWRGDVSTDQVCGAIFGFALAYDLIADEEQKARIAATTSALVEHVLNNRMRIRDVDGKPTQWGRYDPKYASRIEPLNALLWLQALKVAAHTNASGEMEKLYRFWAMDQGYAKSALKARRSLNPLLKGIVNHSDDVLLFLGYFPLLVFEEDPEIRPLYLQSVDRSWKGDGKFPGVSPEANPVYTFIAARFAGESTGLQDAVNTLRWFPFDMKWNQDTRQRYEEYFQYSLTMPIQSPEPVEGQIYPIDRRMRTWSAWVQDPYHEAGTRDSDSRMEYNGHDYLLAYWMGRYYEFISAED
ncbi:MAG: hypothetical protein GX130_03960 [Candidatus Hydrogenedens sp.]|jgi:hypothetical protein|nr:hypothetical protein [Candidatus Hydrogenedens sp.]